MDLVRRNCESEVQGKVASALQATLEHMATSGGMQRRVEVRLSTLGPSFGNPSLLLRVLLPVCHVVSCNVSLRLLYIQQGATNPSNTLRLEHAAPATPLQEAVLLSA